ncbi:hypothetical protein ACKGJN_08715 [Gillisia sp. Q332]|uniref:hypothetical protein n=1 Tax=Gillisia xinjiangensis TaxID=3384765 RepID=UPI00391DF85B
MKADSSKLRFEYLHRDGKNYKIFGSIIIKNIDKISPLKATLLLEKKLIDTEYFYPKMAKIPLFEEHKEDSEFFTDWYEFDKFSLTDETPSDSRSLKEFIKSFEN